MNEVVFTEEEQKKAFEMFKHIAKMDKGEQSEIFDIIERFLWDSGYNPEEFLIVFANANDEARRRWFAKILSITDWYDVVRIFTLDIALKYALDDRTINMLFPEANQRLWKNMKRIYEKYYFSKKM